MIRRQRYLNRPIMSAKKVKKLNILEMQKKNLYQIIKKNKIIGHIVSQYIWHFEGFDQKFQINIVQSSEQTINKKQQKERQQDQDIADNKESKKTEKIQIIHQNSCLKELEIVFKKVKTYPKVNVIILSNQNITFLFNQPIFSLNFNRLMALMINSNNINNIEALQWLHSPLLNIIILNENKITKLKPLANTNFKYFKVLGVSQNPLANDNFINLSKMRMSDKKSGRDLNINQRQSLEEVNFGMQDLSHILKIQANRIDVLVIEQSYRIMQSKVLRNLEQKYGYKLKIMKTDKQGNEEVIQVPCSKFKENDFQQELSQPEENQEVYEQQSLSSDQFQSSSQKDSFKEEISDCMNDMDDKADTFEDEQQ